MRYGIAIIIVIFLALAGILALTQQGGKPAPSGTKGSKASVIKATDYENNDNVRISWERQGSVVGNDQRRAVKVTVTRNERTIDILDGYNNIVGHQEQFDSNPTAFSTFIRALDYANFGKQRAGQPIDERGQCALGNVFVYELYDGSKQILHSWSDTCNAGEGTFTGNANTINVLFKRQITGYDKLTAAIQF